jgi:hypothetical protein
MTNRTEAITIDTITRTQVRALASEAATAGDLDMVRICERAEGNDDLEARQMCCDALNSARDQD